MSKFEVMSTAQLLGLSDPEWLVDNIIPQHGTIQVFGPEGSHKSFVSLDMAFCIATGKSFHGHAVNQGRVLYVAAEGGPPIKKRVQAWQQHHQDESTEGVDWFMKEELRLDDEQSVEEALEAWKAGNYRLVIIDTLRTSISGDEISPRTMSAVTRSLRRLQRELGTTVLIVHHSTKGRKDVYAGANNIGTDITTSIKVSYDVPGPTRLECMKQKDAEKFETIVLRHKPVGESLVMVSGKGSGRTTKKRTKTDQTIIDLIQKYSEGILTSMFVAACVEKGLSDKTVYKRLRPLKEEGLLRTEGKRIYPG